MEKKLNSKLLERTLFPSVIDRLYDKFINVIKNIYYAICRFYESTIYNLTKEKCGCGIRIICKRHYKELKIK